jgi:2-methylcitrate dehydratase
VALQQLGGGQEPFRITETSFKFFPSQIHTQGPIGLALELRSQLDTSDIAAIRVRTYRTAVRSAATDPQKWDPQTRETADHSIPYLVATALQDGAVTPGSFARDKIRNPALRQLISKMTVEEEPTFTQRFPQELNCAIEVTTTSSQRLTAETAYPKGHQRNPLKDTELEAKFQHLAAGIVPEAQCRAASAHLWALEEAANLSPIFDCVVV